MDQFGHFGTKGVGGGGVWAMAGVQGKVAFGLSHFCVLSFSKKRFRPANSHEDPNLTMHWLNEIGLCFTIESEQDLTFVHIQPLLTINWLAFRTILFLVAILSPCIG